MIYIAMLYIYLDKNQIKILYLKKSLLGQYEAGFFEKKHELDLLNKGRVVNVDVLASAIKEGLNQLSGPQEKQIVLILPQDSFSFMKADVPKDISPSALSSFIKDKARSHLSSNIENFFYSYFVKETDKQKQVSFYSTDVEVIEKYLQVLSLLGLKLVSLLPETLALFKLFEKTLRREKKENILYVSYSESVTYGYLYDSGGLISEDTWKKEINKDTELKDALKERKKYFENKDIKLNRIILSGRKSDKIRQDTFTKEVGVWTNPLKRIIPDFYQDYLKLFVTQDKTFPVLSFDVCLGAFIFSQENKDFQMLRKPLRLKSPMSFSVSKLPIFRKEFLIFIASAVASFLIFVGFSKLNINFNVQNLIPKQFTKSSPFPTTSKTKPTAIPAPSVNKEELKIKVLNGSGTAGKASSVKELLQKAGYQEIVTGNADNFDYTKTAIQVKKELAGAAAVLKKDLADSVTNPKVETLSSDENSDIIIIVGSDLK